RALPVRAADKEADTCHGKSPEGAGAQRVAARIGMRRFVHHTRGACIGACWYPTRAPASAPATSRMQLWHASLRLPCGRGRRSALDSLRTCSMALSPICVRCAAASFNAPCTLPRNGFDDEIEHIVQRHVAHEAAQ